VVRIKFHMSKKHKLIFEMGVAVLCLVLFLGTLGTLSYTSKVQILTTDDLINCVVRIVYKNTTSGVATSVEYNASDIATLYDGKLYLSIPSPPAGYDAILSIRFFTNITFNELIDKGLNKVEYRIEFMNNTAVSTSVSVFLDHYRSDMTWHSGKYWIFCSNYKPVVDDATGRLVLNATEDIDLGSFVLYVMAGGFSNDIVVPSITFTAIPVQNIDGIVLQFSMYTISEKPVLKALSEPVYSFLAAMWSALLGVVRRVKSVVASAFGGFSLSAIFTGLIGDPVMALVVSIFVITMFFIVMKPRHR